MKFLFDQNLSPRLVRALRDVYSQCEHVRNVGLNEADDSAVWAYAKNNGFMIVSKDFDFYQRSQVLGPPPKVIWVKLGNCSTQAVERVLRTHIEAVNRFDADATVSFLILS